MLCNHCIKELLIIQERKCDNFFACEAIKKSCSQYLFSMRVVPHLGLNKQPRQINKMTQERQRNLKKVTNGVVLIEHRHGNSFASL